VEWAVDQVATWKMTMYQICKNNNKDNHICLASGTCKNSVHCNHSLAPL
jgi:hypothetical protein